MPVWERDILRVEPGAVDLGPRAAVQNREQPDAGECERDREYRRIVERDRCRPLGLPSVASTRPVTG